MFLHSNLENYLYKKYNKIALNKKELSIELDISVSQIDKKIKAGKGIPRFKKLGSSKNSGVRFSITEIAIFILYEDIVETNTNNIFNYNDKKNVTMELLKYGLD